MKPFLSLVPNHWADLKLRLDLLMKNESYVCWVRLAVTGLGEFLFAIII